MRPRLGQCDHRASHGAQKVIPQHILDRITVETAWEQFFEWPVPHKRFTTRWVRLLPVSDVLEILEYAGSLVVRGDVETGEHLGRLVTKLINNKSQDCRNVKLPGSDAGAVVW